MRGVNGGRRVSGESLKKRMVDGKRTFISNWGIKNFEVRDAIEDIS